MQTSDARGSSHIRLALDITEVRVVRATIFYGIFCARNVGICMIRLDAAGLAILLSHPFVLDGRNELFLITRCVRLISRLHITIIFDAARRKQNVCKWAALSLGNCGEE